MKRKDRSKSGLLSAISIFNKKGNKKQINDVAVISKPSDVPSTSDQEDHRCLKRRKISDEEKGLSAGPSTSKEVDTKIIQCGNASAEKCFEWLIAPLSPATFFEEVWEQKPLHVRQDDREDSSKIVFCCKDFDKILRDNHLLYKQNIDVVSYSNGVKENHTPDGRVYPAVLWDYYQSGCSIRLLNPQSYNRTFWRINSLLQEYFGSFVGANLYLTPPGSQGFAPHYDDIDAFVLQLEGSKQWKVYAPRNESEVLPRFSSGNFEQNELGDPILDVLLQPGDLLYFPRGYIHQAKTNDSEHSLHVTISTHQRQTWGDLLEMMLPRALQVAIEEDVEFRHSLPKDYLNFVGVANSEKDCPERDAFFAKVINLTKKVAKCLPVDSAVDQKSKDYVHSCLPPLLNLKEKQQSVHTIDPEWTDEGLREPHELEPDTEIRVIRKRAVRLVMEDDRIRLYHTIENSRVYQEKEPQFVELNAEQAPVIEFLVDSYPNFVTVEDLPASSLENKMDIANLLFDKGLLMTKDPKPETNGESI